MNRKKRPEASEAESLETEFPKRLEKWLPETFKEEVGGMSDEDLKNSIVQSNKNTADTTQAMNENEELNRLKDELKHVKGGFTDAIKTQNAKAQYCVFELKNRGKL